MRRLPSLVFAATLAACGPTSGTTIDATTGTSSSTGSVETASSDTDLTTGADPSMSSGSTTLTATSTSTGTSAADPTTSTSATSTGGGVVCPSDECRAATDCPAGHGCKTGLCVLPCASPADCPAGLDQCIDPQGILGVCADADGVPGQLCEPSAPACVGDPCSTSDDCGTLMCLFSICLLACDANAPCPAGASCAAVGGFCVDDENGGPARFCEP